MRKLSENKGTISPNARIYEDVLIEDDVVIHDFAVIYPGTVIRAGAEICEHCVIGRIPKTPGCTARNLKESYSGTVIGENTIVNPGCVIYAGTMIGGNSLLGDGCSVREECRIGNYCIVGRNATVNYNTVIGDRTKVMDNAVITGNAIIEEDVFISALVVTTNDNTMGRQNYNEDHISGPHIKKNTTVGAGAGILPGVTIEENCIVGAGALVTRDVPEGKVVMGIPARIIRDVES